MRFKICLAAFILAGTLNVSSNNNNHTTCILHMQPNGYLQYHHSVTVHITARIQRSPLNRNATLVLSSPDQGAYERSSGFGLEGDQAPVVFNFDYRGLDPGTYMATLVVRQITDKGWKEFSCRSEELKVLG